MEKEQFSRFKGKFQASFVSNSCLPREQWSPSIGQSGLGLWGWLDDNVKMVNCRCGVT